jgi:hypothetical protein
MNGTSITTCVETITPELAKLYLQKNISNRRVSGRVVEMMVRDITRGQWKETHQGIAFYSDGVLADGQHRLEAIAKAGLPVRLMVSRGLDRGDAVAIDQHRARTTIDVLRISGKATWMSKSDVAVLRIFLSLAPGCTFGQAAKISADEMATYGEQFKDRLLFSHHITEGEKVSGLATAPVAAAFAMALGHENKQRLIQFAATLKSGMTTAAGDLAAIKLRDYCLTNKISGGAEQRRDLLMRAQRAIQLFCQGKQISRLHAPSSPIYPTPVVLIKKGRPEAAE